MIQKSGNKKIDLNESFAEALELIENTSMDVIITGSAGTGKSTLIEYFRGVTKKNSVVLAPTGVAALNAGGMTIHSFFKFGPDITLEKVKKTRRKGRGIYGKIDVIIIDEISMVRADLLDCVDRFLRLNGKKPEEPFGGVQMVFVGDLYQLPPVVRTQGEREIFSGHYKSEYFFDSLVFSGIDYEIIELEKIYRQKDAGFISMLNRIRSNTVTEADLAKVNERLGHEFSDDDYGLTVCLTTTNKMAQSINSRRLEGISAPSRTLEAEIEGRCESKYFPTEAALELKEGAQVMLLNNDPFGRWVNGTIGRVVEIMPRGEERILVELPSGVEDVSPYKWRVHRFVYNQAAKSIETEESGYFRQYPLRLAWAITIHKSQGKTFNRVIIDTGRGTFAHGQMYVALSRCTSLEGIFLRRRAERRHMSVDERVVEFLRGLRKDCPGALLG